MKNVNGSLIADGREPGPVNVAQLGWGPSDFYLGGPGRDHPLLVLSAVLKNASPY